MFLPPPYAKAEQEGRGADAATGSGRIRTSATTPGSVLCEGTGARVVSFRARLQRGPLHSAEARAFHSPTRSKLCPLRCHPPPRCVFAPSTARSHLCTPSRRDPLAFLTQRRLSRPRDEMDLQILPASLQGWVACDYPVVSSARWPHLPAVCHLAKSQMSSWTLAVTSSMTLVGAT